MDDDFKKIVITNLKISVEFKEFRFAGMEEIQGTDHSYGSLLLSGDSYLESSFPASS